ncbi:putative ABC transporter permease protein [Streptomyces venezuelae]|uniref:FtsX-like permease family protein n=1 Tax=Streptomyces gardneri TaxID=66892 RepID=UPI0006E2E8B0|nr:FtsX-like permease family protein [Streptomyces gardneri]ALO09328.1 putative ABC transporter permease protein [Streptomyces venezuelae]WRK37828.1 FtsX-like permease family protein [Streptomyces venezuelae]
MSALGNPAVRLLAARSLRTHRKAWAAVFAAVVVTSALLGALALAIGSAGLGHARVERYAAAPVVVAGDQEISWTTDPWGSEPTTVSAGLTERVRIPSAAVDVLREVPGVRAAVPDDTFVVRESGTEPGTEPGKGTGKGTGTAAGGGGGAVYTGRSWEAAALAPYKLLDGREPRKAGEVVAGTGAGVRVGDTVAGRTVVGVADGPAAALYVTAQEARRLAGHPGAVDAVGILGEPGVPVDTLHARVRAALDGAGLKDTSVGQPLRALTGDGRGGAEHLAAPPARTELLQLLAAVSGTVLLIAVLVLSSLVAQALGQRGPERDLLLAVGATPRQVRAAAGREVTRVAGVAAVLGALAAVPTFLAAWSLLRARTGVVPEGLVLPTPPWLLASVLVVTAVVVGLARLVVLFSTRRAGRAGKGAARRVSGLVLLVLGAAAAVTATTQGGEAAGAAAGAATVTLVSGCALLGPWIARGAMRILDGPLRRLGGAPGRLTAAGATAHSRRLGAALVPVVLVTAFALVQLTAGSTMGRAAETQARSATTADLAVSGTTAERVRKLPGVTAATDVLRSTVVLARTEAGTPRLDRLPVLGVDADGLKGTLDPGVVAGDLAGLAARGTVAVGADMADSLEARPGSTVALRLGDGTEKRLRVVAVYERSLALGEFLLPKAELAPHMTDPYPARVLAATKDGATASGDPAVVPERVTTAAAELNGIVSAAVVTAIGALTVLSVLSTLALIGAGRRGELALLRQVGASVGQVRRMLGLEAGFLTVTGLLLGLVVAALPLTAFAWALTGGLPYLPPAQAALIAGTVVVTVAAGVFLPASGRRLRR